MQIVIPMSGFGERFRRAGYTVPKPLIEVEGKPIISHVIDMFPGEEGIVFICNQEHLDVPEFRMAEIILESCPTAKILGIPPHKLGPIHAILQVEEFIDKSGPVLVNYCDFTCYWDWQDFCHFVSSPKCDGAIPAYRHFHPHTLGTTNYAYMREKNRWALAIQEKQPYTDNRMEEYASSGTYYFADGAKMLETFKELEEKDINLGGEYYVSLAYIPMLERGADIGIYDLQHFMQWGTPGDVDEYNAWSKAFHTLNNAEPKSRTAFGTVIVPMAGLGKRFADEGYKQTKPLIEVSGRSMVLQAVDDLPAAEKYVFIMREDMPGYDGTCETLRATYTGCELVAVPNVTEGQACSAKLGIDSLDGKAAGPITFGACDFGCLYDEEQLSALITQDVDVIVWAVRGNVNAIRRPQMFGWIDANDNGDISSVSVKTPLANPENDPIVLGTFTFKNIAVFNECYTRLLEQDDRINGEFYLDSCINHALALGFKCKIFEVDSYLSWGTPNDLRTFEYWQSCFHKWDSHPYRLENDRRVPKEKVNDLSQRFKKVLPEPLEEKQAG